MLPRFLLLTAAGLGLSQLATAQNVNNVTEVVTSFNGFWQSSATTLNPIKPDNSHDLLAFSLNTVRYSTGVDDGLLTTRGIVFTPSQFRALPVAAIGNAPTSNTKTALGARYDGVASGGSVPAPTNNIPFYLRDGRNGLNLGTGVANVPAGTLDFSISQVVPGSAGDGVPDILVTQIADPSGSQDQYQFLDGNNQVVGNTVTVVFNNIAPLGTWTADFYEASQNPMTLTSGFQQTDRPLRLWAADLQAFGITTANVSSIRRFRVLLSGSSDLAFVAYNAQTATFTNPPLPVQLTSFGGQATATYSDLTWNTAQEVNSQAFEVETSLDGRTFRPVGRVTAAGNSAQARRYTYRHATTQAGTRYYRLRQVDRDGTSAYSSVVTLTAKRGTGIATVTAAPNPFHDKLELFVTSPGAVPASATVALTTLTGRTVYTHNFSSRLSQSSVVELPGLPALPAGLYLAKVVIDGHTTVVKVEKQ